MKCSQFSEEINESKTVEQGLFELKNSFKFK